MTDKPIEVKIDDKQLLKLFATIQSFSQDLTAPLRKIGRKLLSIFGLTFRSHKAPDGTPWEAFRSKYVWRGSGASRHLEYVLGRKRGLLIDSGKLRQSFKINQSDNVFDLSKLSTRVGTKVPYAHFHHTGNPQTNLPRRRSVDYSPSKQGPILEKILMDFVNKKIKDGQL